MNKPKGNIPQSTIKGSGFFNTDVDFKNNGGKLMFTHPNCVVVGLNDVPYMLFATPDFDERNLPLAINEKIHEVKKIVLKLTFSDETMKGKKHYSIPGWMAKFKKIESIDFEDADLDNLELLKECPIKYISFNNVEFSNKEKLALTIRLFKDLISVACSPSFSSLFKDLFAELGITVLSVSDDA